MSNFGHFFQGLFDGYFSYFLVVVFLYFSSVDSNRAKSKTNEETHQEGPCSWCLRVSTAWSAVQGNSSTWPSEICHLSFPQPNRQKHQLTKNPQLLLSPHTCYFYGTKHNFYNNTTFVLQKNTTFDANNTTLDRKNTTSLYKHNFFYKHTTSANKNTTFSTKNIHFFATKKTYTLHKRHHICYQKTFKNINKY